MARMRFKPDERAAFTVDTKVEWQNGRHWHPGTITGPITKSDTGSGFWYVPLTNHARTATVSPGDLIHGSPGKVRLPQTP